MFLQGEGAPLRPQLMSRCLSGLVAQVVERGRPSMDAVSWLDIQSVFPYAVQELQYCACELRLLMFLLPYRACWQIAPQKELEWCWCVKPKFFREASCTLPEIVQ